MARLRWTENAEESLATIYRAMAGDRPATAQRTLENLLHRLDSLSMGPDSGQSYPWFDGVRTTSYGHFRIAYRPEESGGITVLGIFHGLLFLPPT